MKELKLKYGCNSNQVPSKIYLSNGHQLPIEILNGSPGYINFLDALNGWQLVSELKQTTNLPAAASFKHFSPAGAAIGTKLSPELEKACAIDDLKITSEIAMAYAKARGADRMSSYGDFVALSDECDEQTATILKREVSDGIIAPAFSQKALEILKTKKQGAYNIIKIDPDFVPDEFERREIFGIVFEQKRNNIKIDRNIFKNIATKNKNLTEQAIMNLIVATTAIKYSQSNSVCFAFDGMAIGIGTGQQSRIDCTKLAGAKANAFFLRQHPSILNLTFLPSLKRPTIDNIIDKIVKNDDNAELIYKNWQNSFSQEPIQLAPSDYINFIKNFNGICMASDGFFPFEDCIEAAAKFNVKFISQPGGSIRDDEVVSACDRHNITMTMTGVRLFFH